MESLVLWTGPFVWRLSWVFSSPSGLLSVVLKWASPARWFMIYLNSLHLLLWKHSLLHTLIQYLNDCLTKSERCLEPQAYEVLRTWLNNIRQLQLCSRALATRKRQHRAVGPLAWNHVCTQSSQGRFGCEKSDPLRVVGTSCSFNIIAKDKKYSNKNTFVGLQKDSCSTALLRKRGWRLA